MVQLSSPPSVVVMGVSGVGKSYVGQALAERLRVPYADGDDFHPQANKDKMSAGHALTDSDRRPWLAAIGRWLCRHDDTGAVVSCSALKRSYRDLLVSEAPRTVFLHLVADEDVLAERMRQRKGHFMPVSLLESQEQTLEPLTADENGVVVEATGPAQDIVADFLTASGHSA